MWNTLLVICFSSTLEQRPEDNLPIKYLLNLNINQIIKNLKNNFPLYFIGNHNSNNLSLGGGGGEEADLNHNLG